MEYDIWNLESGVWNLEFGIWNLEFRNWNPEFGIWDFELIRGHVWLLSFYFQEWTNEFLTWNSSNYGDVERIHFAPDEIWVPDIALFNK